MLFGVDSVTRDLYAQKQRPRLLIHRFIYMYVFNVKTLSSAKSSSSKYKTSKIRYCDQYTEAGLYLKVVSRYYFTFTSTSHMCMTLLSLSVNNSFVPVACSDDVILARLMEFLLRWSSSVARLRS